MDLDPAPAVVIPPVLSEKTRTAHASVLRTLYCHLGAPLGTLDALLDHARVVAVFESPGRYATTTLATKYSALVSMLKGAGPTFAAAVAVFRARMTHFAAIRDAASLQQRLSPREEKIWLDWSAILRAFDALMSRYRQAPSFRTCLDAVVVGLYCLGPPARLDYAPMLVVGAVPPEPAPGEPRVNVCLMTDVEVRFVFREYKTWRTYGTIESDPAGPELERLLREWRRDFNDGPWLLHAAEQRDEPMSPASLGGKLRRILQRETGRAAGVDIFRHSWLTHQRVELHGEMRLVDQRRLSRAMAHSASTSALYLRFGAERSLDGARRGT